MEKLLMVMFLLLLVLMVVALGLGIAALWRRLVRPEGGRAAAPDGAAPAGVSEPDSAAAADPAAEPAGGLDRAPGDSDGSHGPGGSDGPGDSGGSDRPGAGRRPSPRLRGAEGLRRARIQAQAAWTLRSSVGGRFAVLAGLAALTMIPLALIGSLIDERSEHQAMVVRSLSQEWGPSQSLSGPLLAVPFTVVKTSTEKVAVAQDDPAAPPAWREVQKERRETRWAVLTPSTLAADGRLAPETRRRGIYGALVWTASLRLEGTFELPTGASLAERLDLAGGPLGDRLEAVHWEQARVVVGLSGPQALRGVGRLSLAGAEYDFKPDRGELAGLPQGFSAPVGLAAAAAGGGAGPLPFAFELSVAGSGRLRVAPVGDRNEIVLRSSWPHPGFMGSSLPATRAVTDEGFEARWSVPALARGYQSLRTVGGPPAAADQGGGQREGGGRETVYEGFVVGVDLLEPVNAYRMTDRAVKYSILFIALNFLIFALWERSLGREAIHPVQYAVIGLALAMFYLVLLALSEHLGFGRAYLAASALDVAMVGGYGLMVTRLRTGSLAVGTLMGLLHLVLYVFLGMEDYALLAGTGLLVAGLAALMVSTRRIAGARTTGPEPLGGPAAGA
jgi:inner membrane protein